MELRSYECDITNLCIIGASPGRVDTRCKSHMRSFVGSFRQVCGEKGHLFANRRFHIDGVQDLAGNHTSGRDYINITLSRRRAVHVTVRCTRRFIIYHRNKPGTIYSSPPPQQEFTLPRTSHEEGLAIPAELRRHTIGDGQYHVEVVAVTVLSIIFRDVTASALAAYAPSPSKLLGGHSWIIWPVQCHCRSGQHHSSI